jgi:hypothetical protein
MNLLQRYQEELSSIPAPGRGCHPFLLAVANAGVKCGLSAERVFTDIRRSIPPGDRQVLDQEITDAIRKAETDHGRGNSKTFKPKPSPTVRDKKVALRNIIRQSLVSNEADLWELSPVRITGTPQEDMILLLLCLFGPSVLIFIGDSREPGILGKTIRTVAEWIEYFRNGGVTAPYIIINSLNGMPADKQSGTGVTLRGNANIVSFDNCLAEYDDMSREDQIKFWASAKLPIRALIDSGGKSIHALLDVQKLAKVETPEQWATEIKNCLYDSLLIPLGIDPACSNPARLSRLPGHFRAEKRAYQRLLWLSPEGRSICQ